MRAIVSKSTIGSNRMNRGSAKSIAEIPAIWPFDEHPRGLGIRDATDCTKQLSKEVIVAVMIVACIDRRSATDDQRLRTARGG